MCGIAGLASTTGADPEAVRALCARLTHRGPDGEGFHTDGQIALGMRRLAVIDPAGGAQPVHNEDRTVTAVCNGELYGYQSLRARLRARGHHFATGSDSECLVHLYEEYGEELVHHLHGMYAFALWDSRTRRLLLARDRVGKKPLHYRRTPDGTLAFASELKALRALPGAARTLDPAALDHYLAHGHVPAPLTLTEDVRKLPPGSLLTWQAGQIHVRRYWTPDFTPRPAPGPGEAAARARALLTEATRSRLVADRPVGAFLSGGLDSSAVVAAMARLSDRPVRTFAVGFEDPAHDERAHARAVARHFGTDHHELVLTGADAAHLADLAHRFDEPFADSSALPALHLARLAAGQVTVALTGDGGDELFGGYRRYALMARYGALPVPAALRPLTGALGTGLVARSTTGTRRRAAGRLLETLAVPRDRRYAHLMACFTPAQRRWLRTGADDPATDPDAPLLHTLAASRATDPVNRLLEADTLHYLPGDLLVKLDTTTMAASLEARSPFLDHHLLEWAAGLPAPLKVRGTATKHLLKEAVRPWLPAHIVDRPKKGFSVPLAHWLRTALRDLTRDLLTDHTARSRGLFRPEAVRTLLAEHAAGQDHAARIWALVQFELWARHALDQPPAPAAPLAPAPPQRV
ncbi:MULTISPECIES: asparagine synthase (glutamine-hydrolyzing) [Streptomyces]|uniref:asparagine synthase (glutamine-hydrolyzing) n=1 Tax=Streptomyces TaxID=1883 RepID=UPI000C6E0B17|nr:asparagine synthase (glutamine-hydrolyzing) [Streptomyces sp. EAG2]PKR44280.1 asparagine synthase (glutamine-hydrolyzing) [Streptomyces sp. EAG2]